MEPWRFALFMLIGLLALPFLLLHFLQAKLRGRRRPAKPANEAAIGRAERRLGRALPDPLRAFYRDGRNLKRTSHGEHYGLAAAVEEYRMLTKAPYGPNGQAWPAELFPVTDLLHGYGACDLGSGEMVEWDPDEIAGGDESDAAWRRSFTRTGKSLEQWLD